MDQRPKAQKATKYLDLAFYFIFPHTNMLIHPVHLLLHARDFLCQARRFLGIIVALKGGFTFFGGTDLIFFVLS